MLAVTVGRPGVVLDGGSSAVDVQSDLASQVRGGPKMGETMGKQRGKPWKTPMVWGRPILGEPPIQTKAFLRFNMVSLLQCPLPYFLLGLP